MYPDPQLLVHLCGLEDWVHARERGAIQPGTGVGFVHLSSQDQVHLPANRIFAGRTDVVLLYLDPGRLGSPVRWEPGVPGDPEAMVFPHLYGPLPVEAVVHIAEYRPDPDGVFPVIHS